MLFTALRPMHATLSANPLNKCDYPVLYTQNAKHFAFEFYASHCKVGVSEVHQSATYRIVE